LLKINHDVTDKYRLIRFVNSQSVFGVFSVQ